MRFHPITARPFLFFSHAAFAFPQTGSANFFHELIYLECRFSELRGTACTSKMPFRLIKTQAERKALWRATARSTANAPEASASAGTGGKEYRIWNVNSRRRSTVLH